MAATLENLELQLRRFKNYRSLPQVREALRPNVETGNLGGVLKMARDQILIYE
jgi:hypothetical protein